MALAWLRDPPDAVLWSMRKLTRHAARHRVTVRACNEIRRVFAHSPKRLWVDDFDGDLRVEVSLRDHIGSCVFWTGSYSKSELAILDHHLPRDGTFVDIGANMGVFSLFAAKRVPAGAVWAFEPVSCLRDQLQANVAANQFTNIHVSPLALSDHGGKQEIFVPDQPYADGTVNSSMASLYNDAAASTRSESVTLARLDDYPAAHDWNRVDLIKIDIEGGELAALRGAQQIIEHHRPKLIVELNDLACRRAGSSAQQLLEHLQGLGYRCSTIGRGGQLRSCTRETLLPSQNVFCEHRH